MTYTRRPGFVSRACMVSRDKAPVGHRGERSDLGFGNAQSLGHACAVGRVRLGTVVDVAVENSLYGEIRATLNLCNRYDVDNFIRQAADAPESLLSRMTGGVHLHTLRCPDKDTFARIRAALEQQGLLYRKE